MSLLGSLRRSVTPLVCLVAALALLLSPLAMTSAQAAKNKAPRLKPIATQTVGAGKALTIRPKASDPDRGPRSLRFSAAGKPGWLTLNRRSGVLKGRAPVNAAGRTWRITLKVTDGRAAAARRFAVKVPANKAPQLTELSNRNVFVGDDLVVTPQAVDPDRGPRPLRYSVAYTAAGSAPATPSWLTFDATTGQLTGTAPAASAGDSWTVTIAATDGLATRTRSFVLTVLEQQPDNRAPEVADQSFSVDEGLAGATVGTVEGTDPDGDDLVWSLTTAGLPFAITAAGRITTTTALDFETTDSYELTVRASDGVDHTDATVTVAVDDVDESPVIDPVADVTTAEDAPLTAIPVAATDPEGADVDVRVDGLPAGLSFTAASGEITGTPTLSGVSTVTVTADDGTSAPAVTTFEIEVTAVNDAPVIADQALTVPEGAASGAEVGRLAAADEDGDALTFSSDTTDFDVAADGTVTVADGGLPQGAGPFTFTVTVSDGTTTATAQVTVTVDTSGDLAPVIEPGQSFQVREDAATGATVGTVQASDPDGDALVHQIAGGNTGDAFGIDPATGAITVAAPLDFETTGSYNLTVVVSAGGKSDQETVTVTVQDVNEAPVVAPIADQDATEGDPITAIPVEVGDPDQGDTTTVTVTGLPAGLAYAGGRISGTPTLGGDFTVTVTATDAAGLTGATTFALAVTDVNDAPVIAPIGEVSATEDEEIDPVVVVATDEEGDDVTLTVSPLPAGLAWDAATGTISGTPTAAGDYSVTVTADDGNGGTATATFAISVAGVNDAPVITSVTPSSIAGTVDQALSVDLTVVATDEDGDDLTLDVTGLPDGLDATDNGDGTVTVAGTPTEAGEVTATVVATDPEDASDTADLAVSIVDAVTTCAPRSVLPCADVPVELPYSLTFDGTEGGLDDTGFTMVDPPSTRGNVDQAPAPATPTDPAVPGYEPGLVATTGGALALTATKGIAYRYPGTGGSNGTNSQLNTLGVGVSGSDRGYELETTVVDPAFAGSANGAQQGGLWFGLGEDDYVKAAVSRVSPTTNKVQLLVETDGVAVPGTTYELNSAPFASGQDVRMVLTVEDTDGAGGTASLAYSVDGGALTPLVDPANTVNSTTLPLPQDLFDGVALEDATSSFAGLYSTKRNAAASDNVVVSFADFAVRGIETAPELHEKYSFTTAADTAVPAGYTRNTGAAWTDAAGIGWVTQASLATGTHVPVDLTSNTRVRTRAGVSALQNRLIHLQYGDVDGGAGTNGNKTPGAFEREVPDGWYAVTVSVGDQMGSTAYDSQYTVNVEGVTAIDRFQATAANEYRTATVVVPVSDGRLTVDAVGGFNTKINYLEIDSATEPTEPDVHRQVRFADEATAPPAGYLKDYGQAYGDRSGADQGSGLAYGWRSIASGQPVSLVGNGRLRATAGVPALRAGLVHMQLPSNATSGVTTPGYWEMAVPDGVYQVGVSVGDATSVDSEHWINIEDQNAVAEFVPTGADGAATHWTQATRTVAVRDGRLTISPASGTNTKINWVTVDSVAGASQRPSVLKCTPANLATAVTPTGGIVCDLSLIGGGVDPTTLAGAVRLVDVATGSAVEGNVQTSGGSDTINFSPVAQLSANTLYRLEIGAGVQDVDGRTFLPYATAFTTGVTTGGGGPVAFDRTASGAPDGRSYTSLTVGPDGRLYAGSITGEIYRFDIEDDGTLGTPTVITTVQDYSRAVGDTYNQGMRTVIGLTFDPASTADNPILWITDNAPYLGQSNVPDFSGRLAKLTGDDLGTYTAIVDGLPRSVKDHETNSIAFGPDGALYFTQGANNAMGAPDGAWGNRAETLLSASVLRLDTTKLPSPLPAKGVNVRTDGAGSYNPFTASAPLTIYARGVRNAYDLLWHSNGHLYVPTNGSAAGGNVPAVPADANLPATCANRPDGTYLGRPKVAAQNSNPEETDYVFDVKKDRYYGHPNPARCEYVLNNGNPTSGADRFENSKYPVGTQPDPNYDLAGVYNAGLHASANGVIEYRGGAFGGALDGKLLYLRYSSGSDIVSFDVAADGTLSNQTFGVTGSTNMQAPLDLTEDLGTGNIYVAELTQDGRHSAIQLLKPQGGGGGPVGTATERLVFSGPTGSTSASRDAVITNTGLEPLVVTGAAVTGGDAGQFELGTAPSYPVTVPAGGSARIPVAFDPTSVGVKASTLTVATAAGDKTVRLRGLAASGLGGSNEPSLQRVMDTLEIPVNVGDPDPSNASMPATQGLIGDEVPAQVFEKALFDAPISITPLAAYGPQNNDPAVHVGWYDAGDPAGLHRQFSIAADEVQGLMIDPDGQTTNIDPGEETVFGLYSEWPYFSGRKAYTEDALNTWDGTYPHHIRVYPYRERDGSTVANAYVVATEEVPGSPFDSQDIVLLVRNVKPYVATEIDGAELRAVNPDPTPFADQIAFNRLQTTADANQKYAETGTVRITNPGTAAYQVTGLPITDTFALVGAPELPFTVAPGQTVDLTVRFTATSTKVHNGTLTVQSNAETNPTQVIHLGGLWQSQSEGGQEPNLSQIAKAFGIGTNIPNGFTSKGEYAPIGDEVLSPYWARLDATKPVTVRQLAAFHTYPNGATVRWGNKGTTPGTGFTGMGGQYAQSLLPRANNNANAGPASGTASPVVGGNAAQTHFEFAVDGERGDHAKNNAAVDIANGCVEPCGQHVRLWPVRDRDGVLVPGSYLMSMDYSGINYDYQDNVYLVGNIRPEVITAPTVTASPGDGEITLSWTRNPYDVGVGYRVWRGTTPGFAVNDAALISGPTSGAPLSTTTFTDSNVSNGTTYYYVVRAVYRGIGNSADGTASATPSADADDIDVSVNFANLAATLPNGYLRDFGQSFGARNRADQGTGLTYGWIGETSRQPVDLSVGGTTNAGNGRWRQTSQSDLRLDTLMHMQADDVPNFNGTPVAGIWEMAVPNGDYQVTVAAGDPAVNSDPEIHTLNVEGETAIDAFVPTGSAGSNSHHRTATVTVTVEDGRLTIDALGGTNTKIDYVDIVSVG
ncbi:putative Ig domain-containing protein [Nocardioides sambongensis]|uniref:putative Ig domain-containing protein n=1 Tax=Nocardioides sambongensis TaxID=2589074 RepID=UPI00112DC3AC|nr:putative Ig domain-containing protein [Nocardioides sambongensis]